MTIATLLAPVQRALAMDGEELRARAAAEFRKRRDQAVHSVRAPAWRRTVFTRLLAPDAVAASPELQRCARAARAGDWHAAHVALAAHVASARRGGPFSGASIDDRAARIRQRFPAATIDSVRRIEGILRGRYDLLGYRDLAFGSPPDWHLDPVSGRRAPDGFWASVPYLDPAAGDHKVIWELNRHQHWFALGRAWALAGDRGAYREFVAQLDSWLAANPPLSGINWASMLELGFRSISWLWALHSFAGAAGPSDSTPWTIDLLVALDRQLDHVAHNLSRYFSPNTHLTGEALALFVAGTTLPELLSARRWRTIGREVLVTEATRQVLGDGAHAELSAHYHRYSTDFYLLALLVARAAHDPAAAVFEEALARQAVFLRSLADDGGRLPLIGDDDGGQLFPMCGREPADCRDTLACAAVALDRDDLHVGAVPEETFWLCGTTAAGRDLPPPRPWPSRAFLDSGYLVSRNPAGDHLVFDAGPHGFLNGGHAHADALSLVLSPGGVPFLVDPGTATYTMVPALRDLFRSSAMHNTVVVNGAPQALPCGPFHWETRVDARPVVWRTAAAFDYIEAVHDAYAPFSHTRVVMALHGFGWVIVDRVLGDGTAAAEAFWHVHPSWRVVSAGPHAVAAHRRDGAAIIAASLPLQIIEGSDAPGLHSYAPAYGRIERGTCIVSRVSDQLPLVWCTFVAASEAGAEEVAVDALGLCQPPSIEWHGAAFRVRARGRELVLLSAVDRQPPAGVPRGNAARNDRGPAHLWGCEGLVTDARFAVAEVRRAAGRTDIAALALVNGVVANPSVPVASSVHHSPAQCVE